MKKYIVFIHDTQAFATLVFILEAKSKEAAKQSAKNYYKVQFGDEAPYKVDIHIIPETGEIVHLTNLHTTIIQRDPEERIYNYTPQLEYV